MLQHDVESFSPAGFVWDEAAQKWQPPHGASATSKGLPGVGAHVYWEHPEARVLIMRYRWTEWPAGYTRRWLPTDRACRVVNSRKESCDVYIGRPSEWGNPFIIGPDGTRAEVIEKYRQWILSQPEKLSSVRYLAGKTLGCYCAPEACHGDVLSQLAALPWDVVDWINAGGAIEAHNSMFERLAWHYDLTPRHGFPAVQPDQWHCSAATARVSALPGALEKLGDALGTDTKKDADGKRLMKKFSILRNPSKKDPRTLTPTPSAAEIKAFESLPDDGVSRQLALDGYLLEDVIDDADTLRDFLAYDSYCADDVLTESDAMARMAPMTPDERRFWLIDQEINWRGIAIDRKGVRDCIAVLDEALEQYGEECREITGGIGPSQLQQLLGWINGRLSRQPMPEIGDDDIPY